MSSDFWFIASTPECWDYRCAQLCPVYSVLGSQTQDFVHARQARYQLSCISSCQNYTALKSKPERFHKGVAWVWEWNFSQAKPLEVCAPAVRVWRKFPRCRGSLLRVSLSYAQSMLFISNSLQPEMGSFITRFYRWRNMVSSPGSTTSPNFRVHYNPLGSLNKI